MASNINRELKKHINSESSGECYVPQWVSRVSLFSVVVCKPHTGIVALLMAIIFPVFMYFSDDGSSVISMFISGFLVWLTVASMLTAQIASSMIEEDILGDYLALIYRDKIIPRLLFNRFSSLRMEDEENT